MKSLIFLSIFIFIHFFAIGLEERPSYKPMKTSIIVPCYHKHFQLIPELLFYLENQTVLPDEVVITLATNDYHKISQNDVNKVVNTKWLFAVKIVYIEGYSPAGLSRNRACECSSGDLLICQDADDIPHPQRVEIIKSLFEKYEINFLIHCFLPTNGIFKLYTEEDTIRLSTYFNSYNDINYESITNGNVSITREVFEAVKWPSNKEGEDVSFSKKVFEKFPYTLGLHEFLLIYRNELSSYWDL